MTAERVRALRLMTESRATRRLGQRLCSRTPSAASIEAWLDESWRFRGSCSAASLCATLRDPGGSSLLTPHYRLPSVWRVHVPDVPVRGMQDPRALAVSSRLPSQADDRTDVFNCFCGYFRKWEHIEGLQDEQRGVHTLRLTMVDCLAELLAQFVNEPLVLAGSKQRSFSIAY